MEKRPVISFYLDTRRKKDSGLYPVRLRVYSPTLEKTKFYPTEFDFSKDEFKSIWETTKPRNENKQDRLKMLGLETKANEAAADLRIFSFSQFEKKLFRKSGEGSNLFYQYEEAIKKLNTNSQFGTASNYKLSLKSLVDFHTHLTGKEPGKLFFTDISPEWLAGYENYMLEDKQRSRTTISMYLRALRTIFNHAIREGEIDKELYPFGANKYQVPAVKNVKKALSAEDLKTLFNATPFTPEQEKAKDFWFFSYSCNGMNVKDIAQLRNEDLQDGKIIFYRAKTINTSKQNLTPVTVYLTDFAKKVIDKYSKKSTNPKSFIFPILNEEQGREKQFASIKNFTRFINQNLKKLASANDLPEGISTYWARHSFATTAIRRGASISFVGEALNHKNPKTTMGYFAGFDDRSKKQFFSGMMEF